MKPKSFKIQKTKSWPLVLGVDISASSLKYVLIRHTAARLRVEGFGRHFLGDDQEEAWSKLQNIIGLLLKKGSALNKAKIVVGSGEARVILTHESLPNLAKKELEQTISFSLQQELVNAGEEGEVVFSYQPLGPDPRQSNNTVFLCQAISEGQAIHRITPFINNEIIPDKLTTTISSLANLIHFLPASKSKKEIGILDIGRSRSMLTIIKDGKAQFYRDIVIGGEDFTKAITGTIFHEGRAIQFGTKEAEEFKFQYGYPLGYSEDMTFHGAPLTEIGTMIRPVVERLCNEIQRSIEFYRDKFEGAVVDEIFLVGGGSQIKHLAEVIADTISLPVSPFSYPDELKISGRQNEKDNFKSRFLEQAVAVSLALESDDSRNLLPKQFMKELKRSRLQNIIRYAAAAVVALIALASFQLNSTLKEKKAEVSTVEKRGSLFSQNAGLLFTALEGQERELKTELVALKSRGSQDLTPIYILRMLSNITPSIFSLVSFSYGEAKAETKKPEGTESAEPPGKQVIISGIVQKPPTDVEVVLAQYIIDLEESGFFSSVNLDKKMHLEEENAFRFSLIAQVRKGG